MKVTSELSKSLNEHLNWNKARMDCFVQMLLGLMAVKTVNLQQIAFTLTRTLSRSNLLYIK